MSEAGRRLLAGGGEGEDFGCDVGGSGLRAAGYGLY